MKRSGRGGALGWLVVGIGATRGAGWPGRIWNGAAVGAGAPVSPGTPRPVEGKRSVDGEGEGGVAGAAAGGWDCVSARGAGAGAGAGEGGAPAAGGVAGVPTAAEGKDGIEKLEPPVAPEEGAGLGGRRSPAEGMGAAGAPGMFACGAADGAVIGTEVAGRPGVAPLSCNGGVIEKPVPWPAD